MNCRESCTTHRNAPDSESQGSNQLSATITFAAIYEKRWHKDDQEGANELETLSSQD